ARAVEIDDNAALVVETENGRKTLNSGEVSIKL
ncbi:MAG: biotin--[acetyl-CoA-carboxylase] ligase, partial [Clostridiales bacterium]|nr:biotin--[acetyl-CoA-carboxylase] ligase [Clostridiales bacterium]